jgi:hypothetical protein
MRAFNTASLMTVALTLAAAGMPWAVPASAQSIPSPLVGAWGQDSSCTEDVAIFKADGSVIDLDAPAGTPVATYSVSGGTTGTGILTLTQGQTPAHFAFAMSDGAVAWSNGATMVLKQRCADQTPFSAQLGHPGPVLSLYDQILALAGQTLTYGPSKIKVVAVDNHPALHKGQGYDEAVAHPEPEVVGKNAVLLYRVFPTATAAAAHATLDIRSPESFLVESRGPGYMSVATARDEGPGGAAPTAQQGAINCLRFHPKGRDEVVITCLEAVPNSRLVAGGRQSFDLPAHARETELGGKDDLTETLDLASMAIDQLRAFQAGDPAP